VFIVTVVENNERCQFSVGSGQIMFNPVVEKMLFGDQVCRGVGLALVYG
jgi:hypothetical protein